MGVVSVNNSFWTLLPTFITSGLQFETFTYSVYYVMTIEKEKKIRREEEKNWNNIEKRENKKKCKEVNK